MKTLLARSMLGVIAGRVAVAWTPILLSLFGATSLADEPAQGPRATQPVVYKDKTAAQWINQLRASRDENGRAQAAEALGFVAREGRLTYGGFSDVPIDSPEPPKLGDESVQPIVAALVSGLNDSSARVRASSAIAISWIGPRAKTAVPALSRLLQGTNDDAKKNALTAIGRIGPDAKAAIPSLEPMLAKGDAHARVKVAGALRMIGAPPDSYLPTLIGALAEDGYASAANYAAMELGHLGNPAISPLRNALKAKDAITRQNAAYAIGNMAGWGNLTEDKESVAQLLIELTADANPKVVWHATQAIGSLHASAERSVPALVRLLKHKDKEVVDNAIESLGEFGVEAKSAVPALIELLIDDTDEDHRSTDHAIWQIGIDRASAESLAKLKTTAQVSWLFVPLCEFPDVAIQFLKNNPNAVDVPARERDALLRVMRDLDPRFKELRDALYTNEHLPLELIAELGEPRFLELIERKLKTANAYETTKLNACARACGAKAKDVVAIRGSKPGDFKPKSAWPGTDRSRIAPGASGHGDGGTTVIVTGQILRADGGPAIAPKLYRINDAMLLGERGHQEVPMTFNAKTGRFVFITYVFAAYSSGDGQKEAGPYQTGSSMVQIESDGCKPLQVRFYDEMPEVHITLSAAQKSE
jgi:HEAT repeat protein